MGAPVASTVTALLAPLADVSDGGVHGIDTAGEVSFVSWRDHVRDAAALAAALRARLDPDRPPHVGVLAGNTPFFSGMLVAAAMSGIVPVGLNPTRRGAALQAWCEARLEAIRAQVEELTGGDPAEEDDS